MQLKKSYIRQNAILAPLMLVLLVMFSLSLYATKTENKTASKETEEVKVATGTASWYGPNFHGRKTATGDKYDMHGLTCASNRYPLGTWLRVTNIKTGKSVIVRVNDRMHPKMKRIIDLSKGAAKELGMVTAGAAQVKVEDLGRSLPVASL